MRNITELENNYSVIVTKNVFKEGEKYPIEYKLFTQLFGELDIQALARFLNEKPDSIN